MRIERAGGVERAITRLLSTPDLDGPFYAAVRQGVRDAIWNLGTSAADMPTEPGQIVSGHIRA
jgi:hypothetical protein